MTQWHPIFAKLLRPVLEGYYEVLTDVPVGDMPRSAHIVLLRRSSPKPLPFRGLWKDLTPWNVLEYKGPTVAARIEHLDLLVELGLGIHRRLNDKRTKKNLPSLGTSKVSFWYLANKLGKSFLAKASQRLLGLEQWKDGVWAATNLERRTFLVSGSDLAVEEDSLPLHVLGKESAAKELETIRLIVSDTKLWQMFGNLHRTLHMGTSEQLEELAKIRAIKDVLIFRPQVLMRYMIEMIRRKLLEANEVTHAR